MSTEWISWIPTVGGRLSYSHIGESEHSKNTICTNITDGNKRYIIAHEKRDLSDSLLWGFLQRILFKIDCRFWFVITASCTDNFDDQEKSNLYGSISIFTNRKKEWRNFEDSIYNQKRNIIRDSASKRDYSKINDEFKEIEHAQEKNSLITFNFNLHREGIIEIKCSETKDWNAEEQKILAEQAFFFFKDLAHIHQHHHHKTDSLISLYDHERVWQLEICRVIFHRILTYKRSKKIDSYNCSLGLIPYIKSFTTIIKNKKNKFNTEKISEIELNYDLITESIELKKDQLSNEMKLKSQGRTVFFYMFFIMLGLVLTASRILDFKPPISEAATKYFEENYYFLLFLATGICAFFSFLVRTFCSERQIRPLYWLALVALAAKIPKLTIFIFFVVTFTLSSFTVLHILSKSLLFTP